MELVLTEQAGTWVVPFGSIMSADDHADLMLIERLRFVYLCTCDRDGVPEVTCQFETARYDDDNLYLDVHTSYPVIFRFWYCEQGAPDSWEWYAVHHRGGGLVVFDKINCLKVAVERSGFEYPLLWG